MSSHSDSGDDNRFSNDSLSDHDSFDPNDPEYRNGFSSSGDDHIRDIIDASDAEEEESLEALRELQIIMIHQMDFEKADSIQKKIASIAGKQSEDIIKSIKSTLKERCYQIAQEYSRRRGAALKIQSQNEINARRQLTDEFIDKQNKQMGELKDLENTLFNQFKTLMDRPIPKYDDMNNRAIQAGMRGAFEEAKLLRDEAKDVQLKKLRKRKEKFEEIYKKQVNMLLDKQRKELEELTEKLKRNISMIEKQKKAMIDNETVSFRRKLLREYSILTNKIKVNSYDPAKARQSAANSRSPTRPSSRSPTRPSTRSPSKQNSQASSVIADVYDFPPVPQDMKKDVLKELASEFNSILQEYRIEKGDDSKVLNINDIPASKQANLTADRRKPF